MGKRLTYRELTNGAVASAAWTARQGRGKRGGARITVTFRDIARRLFGVDRTEFQRALKKNEAERRAKRGR